MEAIDLTTFDAADHATRHAAYKRRESSLRRERITDAVDQILGGGFEAYVRAPCPELKEEIAKQLRRVEATLKAEGVLPLPDLEPKRKSRAKGKAGAKGQQ
jgi:preprotein translocase subunit SecA